MSPDEGEMVNGFWVMQGWKFLGKDKVNGFPFLAPWCKKKISKIAARNCIIVCMCTYIIKAFVLPRKEGSNQKFRKDERDEDN